MFLSHPFPIAIHFSSPPITTTLFSFSPRDILCTCTRKCKYIFILNTIGSVLHTLLCSLLFTLNMYFEAFPYPGIKSFLICFQLYHI